MTDETMPTERLKLITFGGLSIQSAGGAEPSKGATRRQSLALLAFLAVGGASSGVSRDRLCAIFWPESDTERARNALKQTIFSVRRDLREPDLLTGTTELRLNSQVMYSDVAEFASAFAAKDFERAGGLYTGPFLDGVHLRNAPDFERWADGERSRLAGQADMAMREAARAAIARRDYETAVGWWRRVALLYPLDTAATMELMQALALRGDRAAALQQAELHSAYVREELGSEPDSRIGDLVKKLKAAQSLWTSGTRPQSLWPSGAHVSANPNIVGEIPVAEAQVVAGPTAALRASPSNKAKRNAAGAGIIAVLAVAVWVGWHGNHNANATPALASDAISIAPFHLDTGDSTLAFLKDGMVDLLTSTLAGDSLSPRVVATGAARVVTGNILRTDGDILVTAKMIDAATGRSLGQADVSGNLDSLPRMVDQLAAQLTAIQMGEREVTSELLSGTPLAAVKSYLVGRVAFRKGAYEEAVLSQKRALVTDSTFALAALELGRTAGWLGDDAARRWAYERAWANRKKLRPLDRAVVTAMLGPNYPKGSSRAEMLAAWERVAELRPNEPEGWYEAGDMIFHNPWLGTATDREGLLRAGAFFSRALDRAPDYVPALQHLLQLAAHNHDTATVRRVLVASRQAHASEDLATYMEWRGALALRDSRGVSAAWARFQPANVLALQWLAMTSEEDGIGLDDAAAALQLRLRRASTDQERVDALLSLHALALNRGDLGAASQITRRLQSTRLGAGDGRDLSVLDVVYGELPLDSAAIDAVAQIERTQYPDASTTTPIREQWSIDRCILGHWHMARGDNGKVSAAAAALSNLASGFQKEMWSQGANTCALLLNTFVALKENKPAAGTMLKTLDKDLAGGAFTTSRLLWDISVIASGRLFDLSGDVAGAENAARRRNWFYRWPHYLAPQLYDLGRFAERRGDAEVAGEAYGHYLALRDRPDAAFRAQVDRVRSSYTSLTK